MTHAFVLINAEREYLTRLGGHLAELDGAPEAPSRHDLDAMFDLGG